MFPRLRIVGTLGLVLGVVGALLGPQISTLAQAKKERTIVPPPRTAQFKKPQPGMQLIEVSELIRVGKARTDFKVTGKGLTACVLDTGLRVTHVDVKGRVVAQQNFTDEGTPDDASDGDGHGSNVAGIIAANNLHVGIAPDANLIPLKVLRSDGKGNFDWVEKALDWVLANQKKFNITVVNMSLGDPGNYQSDDDFASDPVRIKIQQLRNNRVAVVVAAGNGFFPHKSAQGMSYPGIIRETISVGCVYDSNVGAMEYIDGAKANKTGPDRITPFSQRLHENVGKACRTDIFAPGALVTSTGNLTDMGESIEQGTSQASPVTAGLVLLMQEFYLRTNGELPKVDDLEIWLRRGSVKIHDGDDEDDNVQNTNLDFRRLDAVRSLNAVRVQLTHELFQKNTKEKK